MVLLVNLPFNCLIFSSFSFYNYYLAAIVLSEIRKGILVKSLCANISTQMLRDFNYALVWGKSAVHMPQRCGLVCVTRSYDTHNNFSTEYYYCLCQSLSRPSNQSNISAFFARLNKYSRNVTVT